MNVATMVIIAAMLLGAPRRGPVEPEWTTLPIPRDARHVEYKVFQSEAPPYGRWRRTTFQVKRPYPNADFVANLDKALGLEWHYYGGRPEGWHIEGERAQQVRAGNWCNPSLQRTIDVVVEYSVPRGPNRSQRDERRQTVTVFEAERANPCGYLESGELKLNEIRPGG
jgi:hypothetical protein